MSQIPAGFADEADVVLKFSDSYLVAQGASAGTASNLTFSMNSVFACNITASAGQPQYFTQYSAVYQKYVVSHSRIRWRLRQLAGGTHGIGAAPTSDAFVVSVLYPGPSGASTASSVRAAAAQQYARRHEFNMESAIAGQARDGTQQGNNKVEWIGTHAMSISKIDGEPMLRTSNYEALVSASPTRQPTWTFILQDILSDATYEAVFLMEVDIYYHVKFFDRVLIADSSLLNEPLRTVVAAVVPVGDRETKTPSPPETVDRYTLVDYCSSSGIGPSPRGVGTARTSAASVVGLAPEELRFRLSGRTAEPAAVATRAMSASLK